MSTVAVTIRIYENQTDFISFLIEFQNNID